MKLVKAKAAHDALLQTGFCIVWMAAAVFAFGYFLDAQGDSSQYDFYITRMFESCGVGLIGILMHVYLMMKRGREKDGDDLWM